MEDIHLLPVLPVLPVSETFNVYHVLIFFCQAYKKVVNDVSVFKLELGTKTRQILITVLY